MRVKNTDHSYGVVAKSFHWIMFLLLLVMISVGFYMSDLPTDTPDQVGYKLGLYGLHRSFGILALSLVVLRLGWRQINPVPKMPDTLSRIEALSAHATHMLLYILMLVQPVAGWLMSSFGGHPVEFFGLQLPALVDKDKALGEVAHETHEIVAYILIGVFVIHVAAALFHHFVRKDDVLLRMSPYSGKLG